MELWAWCEICGKAIPVGEKCYGLPNGTTVCAYCCKPENDSGIDENWRKDKMTCREKLAMEHPEEIDPEHLGGCNGCPHAYGYAKKPERCRPNEENCTKCWDREVETDVKTEVKTEVKTDVDSGIKDSSIKDSGERTEFESGAVRDMHEGKGDMASLPWEAVLRLSKHYEAGAIKYKRWNYRLGIPVSSFIDSACRHLAKYQCGCDDEDHLAAAAFNILGAMLMENTMPEMVDLPMREGKKTYGYFDK